MQHARIVQQPHRLNIELLIGKRIAHRGEESAGGQVPWITQVVRVDAPREIADAPEVREFHPLETHDGLGALALRQGIDEELIGTERDAFVAQVALEAEQRAEFVSRVCEVEVAIGERPGFRRRRGTRCGDRRYRRRERGPCGRSRRVRQDQSAGEVEHLGPSVRAPRPDVPSN